MNKFWIMMIVLSAINLGITIFTSNFSGTCGWVCSLIAHIHLLMNDE